jgi:riboflavin biosynthesis pyrimidine reductase
MRALLPRPVPNVDVHEHYAREWLDSGGIRANMVASADGAATAQGLTRVLQTPGDNRIFAALRDLADIVVVGAATALAEGYRPAGLDDKRGAVRHQYGLRPRLPIALASRTLRIDRDAPVFADPDRRPLLITTATADASPLTDVADVLVCGETNLDLGEMRRQLAARGFTRVLCEGGPRLLDAVIVAGELDELCLSITPLLVGAAGQRIVSGEPLGSAPREVRLHSVLEEDGALFLRYVFDRTGRVDA